MDKGANLFWRNGCTDPSWQDAACAKYCMGLGECFFFFFSFEEITVLAR